MRGQGSTSRRRGAHSPSRPSRLRAPRGAKPEPRTSAAAPSLKHLPVATYRLQMNYKFPFRSLAAHAEYFRDLGISDLYLSPILRARPGSLHGYDVIDPGALNPELGSPEEFAAMSDRLQSLGLSLLLDIVPNHMAAVPENAWWRDILENGRSSSFAGYFDIDFHPPQPGLEEQVLLPILDEPFARVLEGGRLHLDLQDGEFAVRLYDHRFPLSLRSWPTLLEPVVGLVHDAEARVELEGLLTDLAQLPPSAEPDRLADLRRERERLKRRLHVLDRRCPDVHAALQGRLAEVNGRVGDPHSFDTLDRILAQQPYRMSFWHVAADEINYRRFFDITDLAALKIEDPAVFRDVHRLVFELIHEGRIQGLRVDHVDGLYDPEAYLRHVRRSAAGAYLVVEKILMGGEPLPETWPVEGTTGYDFLNALGGLFVDSRTGPRLREIYSRFTGRSPIFDDVLYESRRLILSTTMTGELRMLATRLARIAKSHRWSRDFTLHALEKVLAEVLACFPVYRTYATLALDRPSEADLRSVQAAMTEAKDRNPAIREEIFDFVESVLSFREPDGLTGDQRLERRKFTLRFQQVTGPMMAKGMEDTAFYRWYPLLSLNEVGGDPRVFGTSPERLHTFLADRARRLPLSLNATTTHDTKRGEDARLRIHALSEIPEDWEAAIAGWRSLNFGQRTDPRIPDANEEYLLYQALVGAWPVGGAVDEEFVRRIQEYLLKALREAKIHTSWIRTRESYERRVRDFAGAILRADGEFAASMGAFAGRVARAAAYSSLAQTAVKILSPGVPDIYQGADLLDFRLVDPDNRQPVDFAARRRLLDDLDTGIEKARENPWDGRLKLRVLHRALQARADLDASADYRPVPVEGSLQAHAFGFGRAGGRVVVLAGRLFLALEADRRAPIGDLWKETRAVLESGTYVDLLTGRELACNGDRLPLAAAFEQLPVAILRKRP